MGLARTAISGTAWLTVGQYASSGIALLGNLWLARILGPEVFGVFFVVSSWAEILLLVGAFSFAQYIVQAPVVSLAHYHAAIVYLSALYGALVVAVCPILWILRGEYPKQVLTLFFVFLVFRAAWSVSLTFTYVLERAMAYRALATLRIVSAAVGTVLALIVALQGGGVWGLLARDAGTVTAGALLAWLAARHVRIFSAKSGGESPYREVWNFGFRLGGVQVLETLFHRLDGLLLGWSLGLQRGAELGYYAQAKYFAFIPNVAADAGARAVAYRVYAALREDIGKLWKAVDIVQFWTARAMIPIVLVFMAFPGDTFRWLLGPQWVSGGRLLQAIALLGLFVPLFNNFKMLRLVFRDWAGLYWAYGIQFVTLFFSMVVGVKAFGIIGGALAFMFANLVGFIAMARRRDIIPEVMFRAGTIGFPLLAAAITVFLAHVTLSPSSAPWEWIGHIVYVLAVYGLLWFGFEGRSLLRSIRQIRELVGV